MEIVDSKIVYDGYFKIIKYFLKDSNGKIQEKECFERGDSVAALVFDTEKEVFLFTNQYRIGSKSELLEIVAGSMDVPGEPPEVTIKREIEEEIGYNTDETIFIGVAHTSPGGCSEKIYIYFCKVSKKISKGGGVGNEKISLVEKTFDELETIEFEDMKTIIALNWLMENEEMFEDDEFSI